MDLTPRDTVDSTFVRATELARELIANLSSTHEREPRSASVLVETVAARLAVATRSTPRAGALGTAVRERLTVQGLAYGSRDLGLAHGYLMHILAELCIEKLGSAAQHQAFSQMQGLTAYAPADWESGVAGPSCPLIATRAGAHWELTGSTQAWNLSTDVVKGLVVHAAVDGDAEVRTFVLGPEQFGDQLEVQPLDRTNLRGACCSRVLFTRCQVPTPHCLQGTDLEPIHNWRRLLHAASFAGSAHALASLGLKHMRGSHRANRPIATMQAYRLALADCQIAIANIDNLTDRAAWSVDRGTEDARLHSLSAALVAAEGLAHVARATSQLLGQSAFSEDGDVARLVHDAAHAQVELGGVQLLRTLVGACHLADEGISLF